MHNHKLQLVYTRLVDCTDGVADLRAAMLCNRVRNSHKSSSQKRERICITRYTAARTLGFLMINSAPSHMCIIVQSICIPRCNGNYDTALCFNVFFFSGSHSNIPC